MTPTLVAIGDSPVSNSAHACGLIFVRAPPTRLCVDLPPHLFVVLGQITGGGQSMFAKIITIVALALAVDLYTAVPAAQARNKTFS
jgi:hypothetical protein